MSLTNRLSLFFLTALAFVLAGFALTLHVLVRVHLSRQLDERLDATMQALVAAVEVHPRDVHWEPLERHIPFGDDLGADQPRWIIHDHTGRLRDRSLNLTPGANLDIGTGGWRLLVRRMHAGNFTAEALDRVSKPLRKDTLADTDLGRAATVDLPDDRTFRTGGLVLTVAVSDAPALALLRWLTLATVGVSAATWVTAALWGRWLCRRALLPISRMAESARSIRGQTSITQTLDVPATRDELEDMGRAFNELLTDLRESLERKRRFTGDASHQLRTPLTAMLASVEVALRHDREPAEYRKVLEVVQRRGEQLRQIIESLLFLARADSASLLGSPESIDLNLWCKSWLDSWSDHPRAGDFRFRAAPAPMLITTHPGLLGQVLDNLLDNACKYSKPGTAIDVALDRTPEHATVTLSDLGCGIALEQQNLIFEPFFRATEARWLGMSGVGLGLAVVWRLAAILDARVEVASEPGKGSNFRILLRSESSTGTAKLASGEPSK